LRDANSRKGDGAAVKYLVLAGVACADVGRQKNMPEPVNVELIQIIFGEIEFETAVEIFDASFKLVPAKGRD
jgi:hypothetical protein